MSEDDSKRDDDNRDDADAQAILARRRMFVATALAGLTVGTASCEGQISGSASVSGSVTTSGSGTTSGVQTSSTSDTDAAMMDPSSEDAGYTIVSPQPCLMVIEPRPNLTVMDSGTASNTGTPTLPQNGISMPCLSVRRPPTDSGVVSPTHTQPVQTHPAPCLEIAAPIVTQTNIGNARDAGAPQPCLRYAYRPDAGAASTVTVVQPNLPRVQPAQFQPCLTPVRKLFDDEDDNK